MTTDTVSTVLLILCIGFPFPIPANQTVTDCCSDAFVVDNSGGQPLFTVDGRDGTTKTSGVLIATGGVQADGLVSSSTDVVAAGNSLVELAAFVRALNRSLAITQADLAAQRQATAQLNTTVRQLSDQLATQAQLNAQLNAALNATISRLVADLRNLTAEVRNLTAEVLPSPAQQTLLRLNNVSALTPIGGFTVLSPGQDSKGPDFCETCPKYTNTRLGAVSATSVLVTSFPNCQTYTVWGVGIARTGAMCSCVIGTPFVSARSEPHHNAGIQLIVCVL